VAYKPLLSAACSSGEWPGIESITGGRFQMVQKFLDRFLGFLVNEVDLVFFGSGPDVRTTTENRIEKFNEKYWGYIQVHSKTFK
jgi:hypothetical protein